MDSYPGDLLAGVFPLVFAVDAILPTPVQNDVGASAREASSAEEQGSIDPGTDVNKSTRSLFDRFLDVLATSLVDEDDDTTSVSTGRSTKSGSSRIHSDPLSSLLRGEDDDSSDEEEGQNESSVNTGATTRARPFRRGVGSPSLGMTSFRKPPQKTSSVISDTDSVSYARNLRTEKFFQRARILSISTRHGFPPSKDPEGSDNFALQLSQARSLLAMTASNTNALRLKNLLESRPIDGILPAGWLEKHVHALPSALIVVVKHQHDVERQGDQDQHLLDTIEHLRESLAHKRDCEILLVVLTESIEKSSSWIAMILSKTEFEETDVSVINVNDLQGESPGIPTSSCIKDLYKTVRTASWNYYQNQARRVKRKLSMLGHEHQPPLMPLGIRYSFKVAIFYEFLLKHEKSLRYFSSAYRYLQTYYKDLIRQNNTLLNSGVGSAATPMVNPQGDEGFNDTMATPQAIGEEDDTGIEVALADVEEEMKDKTSPIDVRSVFAEMKPSPDIGYQCRAVAEWLNFKLMQAGFLSTAFSESDEGLIAATTQWRKFSQVFLKLDDARNPPWSHWAFVTHQRHVMSQLVERYSPKEITSLTGLARDEVLMQCSAWRNYAATVEATLRLGAAAKEASKDMGRYNVSGMEKESLRGRYVGGLDSEWLSPRLKLVSEVDHKDKALKLAQKALFIFEAEVQRERNKPGVHADKIDKCYNRSAARLYYLAGGILLGRQKAKEATKYLVKAVQYSKGWSGLELAVRRMLIECYEEYIPPQVESKNDHGSAGASVILDSFFKSEVSSQTIRRGLEKLSSASTGGNLKWFHECFDGNDLSLPFSFSVNFPGVTHATAGDTVTASLLIRSNLDYAIHLNSITLSTMAGDISLPSEDLRNAKNAQEGPGGGIIVQGRTSILLSTTIDLPRDVNQIVSDESGPGGDREGTGGKASIVRSARPRTSGICAAAGARLISEQLYGKGSQEGGSQWSVKLLGGKTLRCDGMSLVFSPVHFESSHDGHDVNFIELFILKKKPKMPANIKRTPFEEDNYVASAWSRPKRLPLHFGPRCLRVLGPMPQMVVTNLTDSFVDGKAIEGTVNRVLLKLVAGDGEECRDLTYKVSCSSTLLSANGNTTHLGSPENGILAPDDNKGRNGEDVRTPVLVAANPGVGASVSAEEFGFDLPSGWKLLGTGLGTTDKLVPSVTRLKSRESTYIHFELFRPAKAPPSSGLSDGVGVSPDNVDEKMLDTTELCQTDFDVRISYRQTRPHTQQIHLPQSNSAPGQSHRDPVDDLADDIDLVSLEFSGSIVWTSPLDAEFAELHFLQKSYPAGSRHPSNSCQDQTEKSRRDDDLSADVEEVAIIDGERVSSRCIIHPASNVPESIDLQIRKIRFENLPSSDNDTPCHARLLSGNATDDSIYRAPDESNLYRLQKGSKFGFVYTVEVKMGEEYKKGSISSHLGLICVDWCPAQLEVPQDCKVICGFNTHGPLVLAKPSTLKIRGLPFYLESAPFTARMSFFPQSPNAGIPFEVYYHIENATALYQELTVAMDEVPEEDTESVVLVSGLVSGNLLLAPYESQTLSYTALATKAGKASLPAVSVSSSRYKTWVIDDGSKGRSLFVLP